ncbi:MAG: hypothetical protein U0L02_09750 [Kandleria vitulina]|jgi:hypothetical protein|uniref:hypothetical protein n=1 Tax=Kandleria vitulina TaxID=1630 RepID=UPI002E79430B|nr:hypothetical protein [Kandleria vitulina]MEE0989630.1 hypothetical protein [Kandleria vitulina]
MLPVKLTYGNEGFEEIRNFLNKNYNKEYTLSIYNNLEQATIEVICDFESMVDVIAYVSNVEHDFPEWIGVNELSDSYVVGMNFTRGNLRTPSVCEWNDNKLIEK